MLVRETCVFFTLAALTAPAFAQQPAPQQPAPATAPAAAAPQQGLPPIGSVPGDAAKGAALMAEVRKALGGDDKLTAIKRLEMKGEGRRVQGATALETDFEILLELPDRYLRKEALMPAPGLIIDREEGLNGAETWEKQDGGLPGRGGGFGGGDFRGGGGGDRGGGGGFRGGGGGGRGGAIGELLGGLRGDQTQAGIDPAVLREAQRRTRQADLNRLLMGVLLVTDGSVAWIGTAKSPEGTADVLEITPKSGQPMRLLVDAATHMPLMISWAGGGRAGGAGRRGEGAAPGGERGGRAGDAGGRRGRPAGAAFGGEQGMVEMYLSDYKVVNGVKLPHVISRGSNLETQDELVVKNYKVNPNFKANTFIAPKQ